MSSNSLSEQEYSLFGANSEDSSEDLENYANETSQMDLNMETVEN